ncbi:hypothetical protein CAC42_631 [Sphaceloma murrayae]|uniref:non-specific serine/threonine protein kinase n=1 Tax=Sphaceloma murrayae TaxID=2082308 RepID=A0A2K1QKB8_9PEZI|nr:hypothetical protein CAC42_631 [Sphaceloma murrayae]
MAPKTPKSVHKKGEVAKTKAHAIPAVSSPTIDYAEVQQDEMQALEAIYMEDFEEVEVKSAWSKTSDRAFRIKIKSFSDDATHVTLLVKLTATYPRTAPLLDIQGLDKLHERTQARINRVLKQKPSEMLGEVMIYSIAEDIQEALEDAVQAKASGTLPSLEDERALREAAAQVQEEAEHEAERKRQEAAKAEEERALQELVLQELQRREARQIPHTPLREEPSRDIATTEEIKFDEPIELAMADGTTTFEQVQIVSRLTRDATTEEFLARPTGHLDTVFKLRRVTIAQAASATAFRDNLAALEEELEALKKSRHANVNRIYAFKLERKVIGGHNAQLGWILSILSELSNRGSLDELLEDGQVISLERARQWSLDLLDALEFLHRNGIIHKQINPNNIRLYRTDTGLTTPQLSGTSYNHRLDLLVSGTNGKSTPALWQAPESRQQPTLISRKVDIWDFGVVVLQMLLGRDIISSFDSPASLLAEMEFSGSFDDLLHKFFARDSSKRPSAFELVASDFFRNTAPVLMAEQTKSQRMSHSALSSDVRRPATRRSRHSSTGASDAAGVNVGRYNADFTELHRLGRGGFGEVVKARHKTDGGIYAVKKIKSESMAQLEQILMEVMLLHRLNHPNVVRYYSAWVERAEDAHSASSYDSTEQTEGTPSIGNANIQFGFSSRGLDFVSSSGYKNIQFGDDDDEDESEEDESSNGVEFTESSSPLAARHINGHRSDEVAVAEATDDETTDEPRRLLKPRSLSQRHSPSTLYMYMELCERKTLRDLIMRGIQNRPDDGWRMLHQILEGLAHIHGHGIIHRDLKPDNIFIDNEGNPKIGDFGLATTTRTTESSRILSSQQTGGDMTRSVGTALYVAPELQSKSSTNYNDKVDMYSLGIIFFEMCYPLPTAMERDKVIRQIRQRQHQLPEALLTPEKSVQGSIILSLISHTPSERPSSAELLRSGKVPTQIEDETIRTILVKLSDSGSPYFQKIMASLFAQSQDQRIRSIAWDAKDEHTKPLTEEHLRVRSIARTVTEAVFRRHGAEEVQRTQIFPRSSLYSQGTVFQLLDTSGSLLQLPYDLTLPYARQLGGESPSVCRTYTFGQVVREPPAGGPPRSHGEVDFDIVTSSEEGTVVYDAEIIKVVDEIIDEVPALEKSQMVYHLNHADILNAILDHCRVESSDRLAVKEILSKLNIHMLDWQKISAELRSPLLGIASTVLDELSQFDIRDSVDKVERRLAALLESSPQQLARIRPSFEYLRSVIQTLNSLDVRRPIYICPLACHNEKFYTGGLLFQSVNNKRNRSVFAAGGRYDSLILAHRQPSIPSMLPSPRAVGVNIGWDGLVASSARHQASLQAPSKFKAASADSADPIWSTRRCEVLVTYTDSAIIATMCARVLSTLWAADLSAELAASSSDIDALLSRQKTTTHAFLITLKHDSASTIRIRNTVNDTDSDVALTQLVSHIRSELRERDSALRKNRGPPSLPRSGPAGGSVPDASPGEVQVLMAQHRSKKSNKYAIVSAAHAQWATKCEGLKGAPIVAVETRDEVLEAIGGTRLSDAESWRRVVQGVGVSERGYIGQVQGLLEEWRGKWKGGEGGREVGLYNFRSGGVVYYDVGL